MNVSEFCPLTQHAVAELLADRDAYAPDDHAHSRRRTKRWPFPGTVELWIPNEAGVEEHHLGTCLDMSLHGVGLLYDDPLPHGLELAIAIHQPEKTLHGRAAVCHCTEIEQGFFIGMKFLF